MAGFASKVLHYILIPGALLGVLFLGGYLQEFHRDGLPDAAREAGVPLPLKAPWIEVDCQRMTLSLMDGETLVKRYDIGYGPGPVGRLVTNGESTPTGEYEVIHKAKREDLVNRGSRFLLLDFPSEDDAWAAADTGLIPREEAQRIIAAHGRNEPPPSDTLLGGPITIQGNFFSFMDRRFTDGSVALSNADINELFEHVPVGTRVVIKQP